MGTAALIALGVMAGPALATAPAAGTTGDAPPPVVRNCLAASPRQCYSVAEFRAAYGVQPLLNQGLTGRGQTVVIPVPAPDPGDTHATDLRADLAFFDHTFGLPHTQVEVVNSIANSPTPNLAVGEEVGDVELVHQIAPDAAIKVVLTPSLASGVPAVLDGLARALRLAPTLGSVVSMSLGAGEDCFTPAQVAAFHEALRFDRARHTTVVVSSGDSGAAADTCKENVPSFKGVDLPASDPNVLAVGGTTLQAAHPTGAYIGESVWNEPVPNDQPKDVQPQTASSGGFSTQFATPHYQRGIAAIGAHRGIPDVAASASTTFGPVVALADGDQALIGAGGGTSAGAPFWAGLVALADQKAHRPLGFINPTLYQIAQSPLYQAAFHDVTAGNNSVDYPLGSVTGYDATPGWDPTTGWGSPNAKVLVPLLAALTHH